MSKELSAVRSLAAGRDESQGGGKRVPSGVAAKSQERRDSWVDVWWYECIILCIRCGMNALSCAFGVV